LPAEFNGRTLAITAVRLPWAQARAQLTAARKYWLASLYPDGRIHIMPVWGVWLDDALYFVTNITSRKGINIAANPNIAVHLDSAGDLVSLNGVVEMLTDPELINRVADLYQAKYKRRFETNSANTDDRYYRVTPHLAFTWQESDLGGTMTRWHFERQE
jgi:general stress protein 26